MSANKKVLRSLKLKVSIYSVGDSFPGFFEEYTRTPIIANVKSSFRITAPAQTPATRVPRIRSRYTKV